MTNKLQPPEPQAIVIFGASGDLTRRKLLPALYRLYLGGLLPGSFAIVGYARTEMTDEGFADLAREAVVEHGGMEIDDDAWSGFERSLSYLSGSFTDPDAMVPLREHLEELDARRGTEGRRFFYAATPPEAYGTIAGRLGEAGLQRKASLVLEKPFGTDLATAEQLDEEIHDVLDESQVFRIDHYLGKETVQNILAFRFANMLFEPVWSRHFVDHVQLTVAEDIGLEGRGRFYDRTGALRDMVQTHLFQVLTFLAMEPPPAFDAEDLRDEIAKVLRSMRVCKPEHVVFGQYEGYRDEPDVADDSSVETFVAMRVEVDSWRWADVPFFLRTGKRLPRKVSEATIVYRPIPLPLFEHAGVDGTPPNRITIRIQPDEGISVAFLAQRPGLGISLEETSLDFDYGQAFADMPLVGAYEHLLYEAMHGDHTLFTRQDGVERAWEVLERVLDDPPEPRPYAPGSWGPPEADALIAPRRWLTT